MARMASMGLHTPTIITLLMRASRMRRMRAWRDDGVEYSGLEVR